MSTQTAYPLAVANLAGKLPNIVVLPAEARAYYDASIADADALEAGASVESASVLDEVLRVGDICVPSVLAGKVPGYGPVRMRYFLGLAAGLADKVAVLDASHVDAAGAGAVGTSTLRGTRGMRTRVIRVLKNLAGRRKEEKQRLKTAGRGTEKADERSRSLDALATELLAAIAKVPASVALDAGATPELVDALRQAAGGVLTTRDGARGARGTVASLYDDMNLLDGKLLHELRLLVGAMKDARKEDTTIPAVRSPLLKSGKKKSQTAEKQSAKPKEGPTGPSAAAAKEPSTPGAKEPSAAASKEPGAAASKAPDTAAHPELHD
ncbi:MAG: hypothetical protein QM820_17115 [Minicystis sp.]